MKVFIIPVDGKELYTHMPQDVVDCLLPELQHLEPGDSFDIKCVEMTQEEFGNLPEYDN